jgi:hypothetical protein
MARSPDSLGGVGGSLADTILVPADQLLSTPLLYIDRYYPLREAEWVRLRQVSASWTAVGACMGVILTTIVPMARQYAMGASVKYETWLELAIELGLLVLAFLMSWLFDRRKRQSVRKISDYFNTGGKSNG